MSDIYKRTHMCGVLTEKNIEEQVVLNGWVQKRRNLGGLIFCDIRDKTGIVQVVFNDKIPQELFEKADRLRSEYVVGVKGIVKERESKNPDLATGGIEVFAEDLVIYSEADTPPIYIKDDDNVDDNLRLKYRYLDLRKHKMQQNLTFRHKLTKLAREYFDSQGFTERLSGSQPGKPGKLLRAASVTADVQAAADGCGYGSVYADRKMLP